MLHEREARLIQRMRQSVNADGRAFDPDAIPGVWVEELEARVRRLRRLEPRDFAVSLSRHVSVLREFAAAGRTGRVDAAKDGGAPPGPPQLVAQPSR
jgi:hypothetical protein